MALATQSSPSQEYIKAFSFFQVLRIPFLILLSPWEHKSMGFRLPGIVSAKRNLVRSLSNSKQTASKTIDVPKGYFAVYVGERQKKRFVIPISYLNDPLFQICWVKPKRNLDMIIPWVVSQYLAVKTLSFISLPYSSVWVNTKEVNMWSTFMSKRILISEHTELRRRRGYGRSSTESTHILCWGETVSTEAACDLSWKLGN